LFAPYALRNVGPQKWDDIEKDVADDFWGQVQDLATNMGSGIILERAIYSPLFLERHDATMLKCGICQIGIYNGYNRKPSVFRLAQLPYSG